MHMWTQHNTIRTGFPTGCMFYIAVEPVEEQHGGGLGMVASYTSRVAHALYSGRQDRVRFQDPGLKRASSSIRKLKLDIPATGK